jgi:flagellar biosynthesis protein FlhF
MQYFTIQARSDREALEKMRLTYGEDARILTHRSVRVGGILGFFSSEGVELTGYVSEDAGKKRRAEVEEEKKKILDSARKEQTLQLLLKEIQGLRDSIKETRQPEKEEALHPSLQRIDDLLAQNEFSEDFRTDIAGMARREFSLEKLDNFPALQAAVVEWIGSRIRIDSPRGSDGKGARAVVIVGPTGVGKTTTIAKLAAIHGIGGNGTRPKRVRIVTIDNYRIAAKQQIETYAEIMRIPVSLVESATDLAKVMALHQDTDLILVDTIGRSPRDLTKLAEMKEILDKCGSEAMVYLAVSATTKASDTEEILRQFEPFKYRSIILTKLDETMRIGSVISSMDKHHKSISYLCDGQGVPQDLEEATVGRLLMNMEGFRIDREAVEQKFGVIRKGH